MNSYPGQDTLISYLKKQSNKSYRGFLILHKNVVVASVTSDLKWYDLENTWASNYIREVEKIFTDQQEVIETLKQKVCIFSILQRWGEDIFHYNLLEDNRSAWNCLIEWKLNILLLV
ncbi:hypothetical protein GLOIN_2v1788061 [Rhizophagus irregularis DAOM 181602=DAOM 197198]|nr:hypothetical protein GLOIN_2v1788061 [Rhizophagus irregularis DAOM 181602=DAOM 197198]